MRLPKKQIKQNRPKPKKRIKVKTILQPIILQKRQKTFKEKKNILISDQFKKPNIFPIYKNKP